MNETQNTRMAELFDSMVAAYETWAEPLSTHLAQLTLRRTTVSPGDCVLDIGYVEQFGEDGISGLVEASAATGEVKHSLTVRQLLHLLSALASHTLCFLRFA